MLGIRDLINHDEPALPLVRAWITEAKCPVEVLPCQVEDGERALLEAQVTTRSPMGAICHGTGGILVDHGWLRILGAGCPRLPRALMAWSRERVPCMPDGRLAHLIVADDVLGGVFALGGPGSHDLRPGKIAYFAPDTLRWEDLGLGYSEFLCWTWSGDLARFTEGQRWPGWIDDCRLLAGDRGFLVYPFLWAAGPPIAERHRAAVPLAELWAMGGAAARQLNGDEVPP
jgi:hypothetical protein